jgi:hypothetical protein
MSQPNRIDLFFASRFHLLSPTATPDYTLTLGFSTKNIHLGPDRKSTFPKGESLFSETVSIQTGLSKPVQSEWAA